MESPALISVMLGGALGMKHALEPDHLVAVGTLMHGETRARRLLQLGALWGAGHLSTVAVGVGLLMALRVTLEAEHLPLFEAPVAAMMIGLGVWTLITPVGALQRVPHGHHHARNVAGQAPRPRWWSYAVGSVHGLAGTGALVVFVAASFSDISTALAYVVSFGVGAMLGMALITSTLAYPLRALQGRPASAAFSCQTPTRSQR